MDTAAIGVRTLEHTDLNDLCITLDGDHLLASSI